MDRTRQYNAALMDIKANIDQAGKLEDIKFCCGNIDGFSASELESITSVTHLYKKLQQLDMLSIGNTKDLKGLLADCNLVACVKRLEKYENGGVHGVQPVQQPVHSQGDGHSIGHPNVRHAEGPIIQAQGEDLSEAFDIIVDNIGREWRRLARRLPGRKVTETEIEVLTDRHSRDLREQSRGVLLMWQEKNPDQAKKEVLVKVLRQCEMNYIADRVEGWQER